jgi:hypothetical protein
MGAPTTATCWLLMPMLRDSDLEAAVTFETPNP